MLISKTKLGMVTIMDSELEVVFAVSSLSHRKLWHIPIYHNISQREVREQTNISLIDQYM